MAKRIILFACMSLLAGLPCSAALITINTTANALVLASLPPGVYFYDDFPTTVFDPANWTTIIGDPNIDGVGIAEPSEPYSLRLNGYPDGQDGCESRVIDLEGLSNVGLIYWYERTGGGDSPEPGEDLAIDYWNDSIWVELERQPGSGPDMTEYVESIISLPTGAMHSEFRLRVSSTSSLYNDDDWFVDDILVADLNNLPPIISLSSSEFTFYANEDCPNPDDQILTIRNAGGGTLNWAVVADCNGLTCDWLTVDPCSGSSTGEPNDVTLAVDISGLDGGIYDCNITVSDPCAMNNPQYVSVTLEVHDPNGLYVPLHYPTIQAAINSAFNGETVIVADGTYTGPGNRDIDFLGKAITVKSANGPQNCIIDCQQAGRGFYFHNYEGTNSVVDGFTIMNGHGTLGEWPVNEAGGGICCDRATPTIVNCVITNNSAYRGGAIFCTDLLCGRGPEIRRCLIAGNSAEGGGGGIVCWESSPLIHNCIISNNTAVAGGGLCSTGDPFSCFSRPIVINCVIADNTAASCGGGIDGTWASDIYLYNSIVWGNTAPVGDQVCLYAVPDDGEESNLYVYYSDIQGGTSQIYKDPYCDVFWGPGSIDIDPLFAEPIGYDGYFDPNGTPSDPNDDFWVALIEADYHLKSRAGRLNPNTESWIIDPNHSPCIDAGDPCSDYSAEPWPHGHRVNMGAYGNTPEASRGCTNMDDVRLMGADWLYSDSITDVIPYPDGDGIVDLRDYAFLALHWLCQEY